MAFEPGSLEHTVATSHPDAVMSTAMRRVEMGLRPGGFGVLIVKNVVDELVYNERGNEVLLIKQVE